MERWAIVLGAGDGTRLNSLTCLSGTPVPKQYCTLDGGPSLFDLALDRAESVVAPSSVLTVVAERHREWWTRDLGRVELDNMVVQPENRGTAAGVLLPLLEVQQRDPRGLVVLLASDHWVADEGVLSNAVGSAFEHVERDPSRILMLGISPEGPETGYGWIVPGPVHIGAGAFAPRAVDAFVEKPDSVTASRLMRRGGLWNSFLIVAGVQALIDLYARRLPHLLSSLSLATLVDSPLALADLYAGLDHHDFSRDLLQGSEHELDVLRVPACGWTDLGTPPRVADCLRRAATQSIGSEAAGAATDRVNLASVLGVRR